MGTLQIIIWIVVAVCAIGTLIAALVVNKDKLKRDNAEAQKESQGETEASTDTGEKEDE